MTKEVYMILIAVGITLFTRAFPFLLFSGKRQMPLKLQRFASILPPAIMSILVIYCLRSLTISPTFATLFVPLVSVLTVVLLHIWRKSTILSIGGGTLLYMLLLRVFDLV